MSAYEVAPLQEGLEFGARIRGLSRESLENADVRRDLARLFEETGMLVFEDVEPSQEMHVAVSSIAGPLKEHLQKAVPRVDGNLPGVIEIVSKPDDEFSVEIDGRLIAGWIPWHFDHCYNDQLNRGGVLRAIDVPSTGGTTGFADGIALYNRLSPALRAEIEDCNVVYRMNVIMGNFRFGRPESFRSVQDAKTMHAVMEEMKGRPRAIHPAVWQRASGEKVLHVSPWMAEGLEGAETSEGDALLDAVCREIFAIGQEQSYWHKWNTGDMVLWDNWRMLHAVGGHGSQQHRRMQRTTIQGDYGLGRFEEAARGPQPSAA